MRDTMPAPYSHDLRQKAIEAFKSGERKSDVCRMFDISRNTLELWLKREAQTGDYQAITHFQKGYQHKITAGNALRNLSEAWR
jgi:transposase